MKRAVDVIVAGLVLALTSPLWLISAALVKATSPGPVLYRAERAGLHGHRFEMFKFRTMGQDLDSVDQRVTEPNDSRITVAGKLLRRSRLDELPQLLNILRGEMSLVGPRPEDIDIVDRHYTGWHHRSLTIRPGVVCLSEITWYPDLTHHDPPPDGVSMQDWYVERHLDAQVSESLRYVDQRSLRLDLSIIGHLLWLTVRYAFADPPAVPFDPTDHRPIDLRSADSPSADSPSADFREEETIS